jgi:hypothetical protein
MKREKTADWRKRVKVMASKADAIPYGIRAYVVAIGSFLDEVERYRDMVHELHTFNPITEYLDNAEGSLKEGFEALETSVDEEIDVLDVVNFLVDDTAQCLEDALDDLPIMFRQIPTELPKGAERVFDDVEKLGERIGGEIREKGYHLYSVLTGTA